MKIFGEQSVKNTICRILQIAFPRPTLCPLHELTYSELGHGTKEPWPCSKRSHAQYQLWIGGLKSQACGLERLPAEQECLSKCVVYLLGSRERPKNLPIKSVRCECTYIDENNPNCAAWGNNRLLKKFSEREIGFI